METKMRLGGLNSKQVGVVGLGYVGLPLAAALSQCHTVIGYDIDRNRVSELSAGIDRNDDLDFEEISKPNLIFTNDLTDLRECSHFIVAVPTPIDSDNKPDLQLLAGATEAVARVMREHSIVIFESTVYPGLTEDFCVPIIEKISGLKWMKEFHVGYSPERVNPGDKLHTIRNVTKVISGDCEHSLAQIKSLYEPVIHAGVHSAPSIKVAEAAKVIENVQRDLNIALVNEIALICKLLRIKTSDVLAAAGTKWNFHNYVPGLVGGHCIGVDPYYLTTRALELGYDPRVILAGRSLNDSMARNVADMVIIECRRRFGGNRIRVAIFGVTFKENCKDIRNSKTFDLITCLRDAGVDVDIFDPVVDQDVVVGHCGIRPLSQAELQTYSCILIAVPHKCFVDKSPEYYLKHLDTPGYIFDLKSALPERRFLEAGCDLECL